MKPVVVALLLVAALAAGCGGAGRSAGPPSEDPSVAFTRLVHHELVGQRDESYAMLIREQRDVVPRSLYVSCSPGTPIDDADVIVMRVFDETYSVPELGKTETKAISWRLVVHPPDGEKITLSRKGHLIAQDGQWRWTLSQKSFASLRDGVCP